MPHLKTNHISMYYEIHGEGEPIVFIGGFGADHTVWFETLNFLKDQYQVILFDNRGAGQSDIPNGPYSLQEMADDVYFLCNALRIQNAHFVGNSMGGFILQSLALRYPKLVKSAIIGNSAANINNAFHVFIEAQLELIKANAPVDSLLKVGCSWLFSYSFLSQPGVLSQLIKIGLDNPFPFTIKGYEAQSAALEQFDSSTWLKQIQVPVLVLGSDEDIVILEKECKFLAEQITGAQYYSFKGCGHLPQLERPEEFANVVKQFIER